MCYCKWEHAQERSISLEWAGRSQAIESSLVKSIWVYPKIVFLASPGSRGQDSTQFGSRIFRAILVFQMKLSTIDWIDGTSIHSIPLCGTQSHSSHFLLGPMNDDIHNPTDSCYHSVNRARLPFPLASSLYGKHENCPLETWVILVLWKMPPEMFSEYRSPCCEYMCCHPTSVHHLI